MQLFKHIAAAVDSAVNFQIVALLLIFSFFCTVCFIVIKRPKDYYKEVEEEPLRDQLENDKQ